MHEDKGFIEGELLHDRIETRFIPLPAWDMEMVEVKAADVERDLAAVLERLAPAID